MSCGGFLSNVKLRGSEAVPLELRVMHLFVGAAREAVVSGQ